MDDLGDVVEDFLVEGYEELDRMDQHLVTLEENGTDPLVLASIFRTIHTIKGTCGFLGFNTLGSMTHSGENLLSRLRDGELEPNTKIITALLTLVDSVREIFNCIEKTGTEGEGEYGELIKLLDRLNEMEGNDQGIDQKNPDQGDEASQVGTDEAKATEEQPDLSSLSEEELLERVGFEGATDAPPVKRMGELLVDQKLVGPEDVEAALEKQTQGDPRHIGEILLDEDAIGSEDVSETLGLQQSLKQESSAPSMSDSSIRVDVGLLDKLMNQVGELVLVRNQILQHNNSNQDQNSLNAASQRLNLITTELQEQVMKTRMQPIGNVWNKFPRVVRDLARSCNKKIDLKMEGKDTELDKTLIEAIKDPLTHIVRNSADHGIEYPEERLKQGKAERGTIKLHAYHEGGQVIIEIVDDGAGIDPDKLKQKAIDRGIITREQATRMRDQEIVNLIFKAGFSTAEKVTNVSGRGVGMDVVKTNIEKIGGTVDIQSRPGLGTTLKVKIPLTLAIVPALLVTSAGNRYAIPQISLLELVRLEGEQVKNGIEYIHGAPVYRLREKLLPLVDLNRELKKGDCASLRDSGEDAVINIVVLQADERKFGLIVDEVNDTEEIVVKPLGKESKNIAVYAGATIMGDGRVALILDILGLAQRANVVSEMRDRNIGEETDRHESSTEEHESLLLFSSNDSGRMAIPLSVVSRLEEIPGNTVETAGDQDVIQYRGQILPLIDVENNIVEKNRVSRPEEAIDDTRTQKENINVVVCSKEGRTVGLVVDRIHDIVDEALTIKRESTRPGVLYSVVVQDKVTDLLDVEKLIQSVDPLIDDTPAVATGA